MQTIVEKIVNKQIPAVIVFEDENIISFIDNNPINKGHLLICPKKPYTNIYDLPSNIMIDIMNLAKQLTKKMVDNLEIEGATLMQNNAELNTLNHFHLHIIPRFKNDSLTSDNIRIGNLSIKEQEDILKQLMKN